MTRLEALVGGETFDLSDRLIRSHLGNDGFGLPPVSRKTERRVRENLRDLGKDLFVCGTARRHVTYSQKDFVGALLDWGWFGTQGSEPLWYLEGTPHP